MSDNYLITSISPDCFEYDDEDEVEEIQPVNEWIREYARIAAPNPISLTIEQVREAIKDDFPELAESDLDIDQLLEEVGIHVTADERDFVVAWYGTLDEGKADHLLEKYKEAAYSNVRKKLGIDYLWILYVRPLVGHTINAAFEAIVQFKEIEEKPECFIINL